jgi:hypothetical protein
MEREVSYLFAGLIYQKKYEHDVEEILSREFGEIFLRSDTIPFNFTEYYVEEMGENLQRKWILFDRVIEMDSIVDTKNKTIMIEKGFFSTGGKRRVNIDPGYVTLSKVVLPTTKDCAHRIYLRDGIYAEITLIFFKGKWTPLKWTYRDYCTEIALEFFEKCRKFIFEKRERDGVDGAKFS